MSPAEPRLPIAPACSRGLVDEHGNGPTCAELIEAVFEIDDWDAAIEDPGRTLLRTPRTARPASAMAHQLLDPG